MTPQSTYILESRKPINELASAFEAAVKAHNFGVLHVYDLKETLAAKGFPISNACRIYEICNPKQASAILTMDMKLNMALPCRVSIYEESGVATIGMIKPTTMLATLSSSATLQKSAAEVETAVMRMMEDAQ